MTDKIYIDYIPISKLVKMDRNPKLHSPKIDSSFRRYGYVEPVLIDEGSGKLVAGHGRLEALEERYVEDPTNVPARIQLLESGEWAVPVIRGISFESEHEAEEYGITSNALVIAGGFDDDELEKLIADVEIEPIGLEHLNATLIGEIDAVVADIEEDPDIEKIAGEIGPEPSNAVNPTLEEEEPEAKEKKLSDEQIYDQLPFELKGVFELSEEAYWLPEDDKFHNDCIGLVDQLTGKWTASSGANAFGIPNLRPDRLVESLPSPLLTWGDRMSTPDDGKSWYFYNYAAAPHRDLPFERTLFSFFTHDNHIETWWATPAYRTGQILVAGVKNIIVPDFSLWDVAPTAAHIWSVYRAAWLGRYFQEAGLRVIPRLEFFQDKAKPYSLLGIPYEAPIVATQFQTAFDDERIPKIEKDLKAALDILKPGRLLVYAGKKGREMIEKFDLPCDLTVIKTSSEVRKKEARKVETDPNLLALRKAKRGKEASRATTPNA